MEKILIIEANYESDKVHINFIKFVVDKTEKETINFTQQNLG